MWLWCVVWVVVGLAVGGDKSVVINKDYGEPCTCDTDCDLNQWLRCSKGRCTCLSSSFLYDHTRHSCVVKLGKKCFEVVTDLADYKHLPPYIKCVEGAFCSIAVGGLCACNTYAYYADGKRCEEKKDFGSKCSRSGECKSDSCQGSKCSCREEHYYDSGKDKCLGGVGSYCFTDEDCTPQAICNEDEAVCTCSLGYSPSTPSLHCVPELRWGASCNTSCNNPTLSCQQQKCGCKYPGEQVLEGDECKSLVHTAPCAHHTHCVQGAKCHTEPGGFSECRCEPGHVEMPEGSCSLKKGHGEECQKDQDCDPLPPFVCIDGTCKCGDGLTTYSSERRVCLGLHGWKGCTSDQDCAQDATCFHSNPKLTPKCRCPHKASKERSCLPP